MLPCENWGGRTDGIRRNKAIVILGIASPAQCIRQPFTPQVLVLLPPYARRIGDIYSVDSISTVQEALSSPRLRKIPTKNLRARICW